MSKLGSEPQAVLEYGKAKLTWFEEIFEEYYSAKAPIGSQGASTIGSAS